MLTLSNYYKIQAFLHKHVQSTCSSNMYRLQSIIFFHFAAAKSRLVQLSASSCAGLHCGLSTGNLAILLHPHWFFHCVCQFGILVSCHQLACTEQEDTLTMCFFCAGKCGVQDNEDLCFWYRAEWQSQQSQQEKLSEYKAYCQILNDVTWHYKYCQKL